MLSSLRLAEAAGALCVGHAVFSGVGMLNAVLAKPPARPKVTPQPTSTSARLTPIVKQIYSGGGVDESVLRTDATFIDPAASCYGRSEVVEAFRALGASCKPEHVEEPLAVPESESVVLFHLHQRYFHGSVLLPNGLTVKSLLVVRADAVDGRIVSMEERWNHAPLLQFSAFRFVRRVNGILSSVLTPQLAR